MDDGRLGGKTNHLRAWTALDQPDDWCLVVEDDATLCTEFLPRLDDVLQSAPAPVVSLYLGTSYHPIWWAMLDERWKELKLQASDTPSYRRSITLSRSLFVSR